MLKKLDVNLVNMAAMALLIVIVAGFGRMYVAPVLATLPVVQSNIGETLGASDTTAYIVVAQAKSNKKSFKRRHKKKQRTRHQSSRHNFYDAQVNNYRGRKYQAPGRDLRSDWCLDCFAGGL